MRWTHQLLRYRVIVRITGCTLTIGSAAIAVIFGNSPCRAT